MNPREVIARLSVAGARYGTGGGGIPELTNIDIAGALGMVQDRFARDVFAAIWWPDGAAVDRDGVPNAVLAKVMTEFGRRQKAATVAKLELHIAECGIASKRAATKFDHVILEECRKVVERARKACWPWNPKVYARLYTAIVHEIHNPRHCTACHGRKTLMKGQLKIDCTACAGTGLRDERKRQRAVQLGIDPGHYRTDWFKVYEWTYDLVKDAETHACSELVRILATREPEAA